MGGWLLGFGLYVATLASAEDLKCNLDGASTPAEAAELWFRQGMLGGSAAHEVTAEQSFRAATICAPTMAKAYNNLGATLGTGRLVDALEAMNHALQLNPALPGAPLSRQRLYNSAVPGWHFSMMNDKGRNEAFQLAIERALRGKKNVQVLDLGSGAGLLAMMAARAGAERVTAVDATPLLAEMARNIIARNGFQDRITVHTKWSLDLTVGEKGDLEAPADLVVSEVVNTGLIGEGMLKSYNDLWKRGLAKYYSPEHECCCCCCGSECCC